MTKKTRSNKTESSSTNRKTGDGPCANATSPIGQSDVQDQPTHGKNEGYFGARDHEHRAEKRAIAECIVKCYLNEGDSILLDAGSSLYPIAQTVGQKAQSDPGRTHYTIMTHNYKAFEELVKAPREGNLNIVLAGGRYDQDLNALFGSQTVNAYNDFFPRVVLIGISGFVADIGLFCHGNTEEFAVKEAIFGKRARDRIIVADHTKIGLLDGFRFGASQSLLAKVDRCIVVTGPPPGTSPLSVRELFMKQVQLLETQGVEVKVVDAKDIEHSASQLTM
jgi:DeoR/GlpR family transcriptional regulator of sugar metabolism